VFIISSAVRRNHTTCSKYERLRWLRALHSFTSSQEKADIHQDRSQSSNFYNFSVPKRVPDLYMGAYLVI